MKYSEFGDAINNMGYYYEKSDSYHVIKNSQGLQLAYVSRFVPYSMGTIECSFKHLDSIVMKNIIDICYNLASTPLEEREDEKKFHLKMEGLDGDVSYLNLYKICGLEEYMFNGVKETGGGDDKCKTIFTDKDTLKMPENIQKAIELGIITKVEITNG